MIYFVLLVFFIMLFALKFKGANILLKSDIKFKIAKKCGFYYTKKLNLNFLEYKNYNNSISDIMLIDHIISCAKFNTPKLYNKNIDFDSLKNFGVDTNAPILYFDFMNKNLLNAISITKTYCKFNAVTSYKYFNDYHSDNMLYLDDEFCSMNLFTSIMSLNVYQDSKFKVRCNKSDITEICLNGAKLQYALIVDNNTQHYIFSNNQVKIEVEHFSYDGDFYCVNIDNSSGKSYDIDIYFNFDLPFIISYIDQSKNKCSIFDIKTNRKKYFICDKKVKYTFELNGYKYKKIKLSKQIQIKANQNYYFSIYYTNTAIKKDYLPLIKQNYFKKIDEIFNIKVKSSNLKINNLINYYLKKQIYYTNFIDIKTNSFDEVFKLYKEHSVTALDFYMWLKSSYLGLKFYHDKIKVNPICKFDYIVIVNSISKVFQIDVKHTDKENYVFVAGTKYHNIDVIPFCYVSDNDRLLVYL